MGQEEVASLYRKLALANSRLQQQETLRAMQVREAKDLADSQARQLCNLADEMSRLRLQYEQARVPSRAPSPSPRPGAEAEVFNWDSIGAPADPPGSPGKRRRTASPPLLPTAPPAADAGGPGRPPAPPKLEGAGQSATSSITATGRLSKALTTLQRAVLQLQDSATAGSHALSNRIDRVKIQIKAVKEAFKELLKQDEHQADMLQDEVDEALDVADNSLDDAADWEDNLALQDRSRKEAVSSRPRVSYSQFSGEQTDWFRFLRDCKTVRQQFSGDQAAALTVILGFCSQTVQKHIKKYLGQSDGLDQAMAHLDNFYGHSHLALPSLKEQIRQVKAASNMQEVPGVCTKLLHYLEAMAQMMPRSDPLETHLVHDTFRKLFLSSTEATDLVPHLKMEKISLEFMLKFVKDRFVNFELLRRTIMKPSAANTAGAMGLGGQADPPKPSLRKEKAKKQAKDEDKDSHRARIKKEIKCFYCEAKKLSPSDHKMHLCPKIGPAQRVAVGKLGHCTDCLAPRLDGHICIRTAYKSEALKLVYCTSCQSNLLFCTDTAGHPRCALPATTQGCLALASPLQLADAGQPHAFAATLTQVRSQGMAMLRGLDDATPGSVNKGQIGRPASLYSVLTLVNGQDRLQVNILIDSGSESSYYSPAIEAMAVRSQPRSFKIETLAISGPRPQVHQGLQSSFIIEMAGGEPKLQVDLLRHDGMEKRKMKIRPKLLTVKHEFAIKHDLLHSGLLVNHGCSFTDNDAIIIPGGHLQIILGQDLVHLAPTMVDSYVDEHGRVDLWLCPMQGRLLCSGNRSWPCQDSELDDLLQEHTNTTAGLYCEALPLDHNVDSTPLTTLMAATTDRELLPTARVAEQRPAIRYLLEADRLAAAQKVDLAEEEREDKEIDNPLEDPHLLEQARAATARTLLAAGLASPGLHSRLEHFAYAEPQPEHRLQAACLTCKACPVCVEGSSGETLYLKIATAGFRQHCLKIPMAPGTLDKEDIPVKYHFKIKYLMLPDSSLPGLNLLESYSRHCSLRRSMNHLPEDTQQEFSDKLTAGLNKGYWEVVEGFDVLANLQTEQARRKNAESNNTYYKSEQVAAPEARAEAPSRRIIKPTCPSRLVTHFLPTGVVMKESPSTTRARLVLDPSRSINTNLIKAPNLENPITSILRRLSTLPFLAFADIGEAFWRMRLDESSSSDLCFLMDQDRHTGRLSASGAPGTKLVCLRPSRSIMGISQSPAFLSLAKLQLAEDVELDDKVLAHHIRQLSYVDDCGSGLTTEELAQVEGMFTQDGKPCSDPTCCGESRRPPSPDSMVMAASPEDELRAVRHLLQGQAGRTLTHRLAVRLARLEAALRACDMPTRGFTCNLESVVCKTYLNAVVLHYARLLGEGKVPQETDMHQVPVADGFQVDPAASRWCRPWKHIGPTPPAPPANRDPIIRVVGPSGRDAPEGEGKVVPAGQSTLLGYLWDPAPDTLSTCKLPYVNLLPARRGVRPGHGRLYTPEDVVALHKKLPKGLSLRHCLSGAHNLYDPLAICPWASVQLKFCYRLAVVDSRADADYNTPLSDVFVRLHLAPGVQALLYAKRHLVQRRSWRLPPCIDYRQVTPELPVLCDGAFGILSASAAVAFLVQRYQFAGEERASIHLYGASTELSPLTKPHHQVDAEMAAADLAQKQAVKARRSLAEAGLEVEPHLISDSQTVLTICTKMAVALELAAGLVVSRVQEAFTHHRMYHTPGANLLGNVDKLTRYDPRLFEKINGDFYQPQWLKLPMEKQPIIPVAQMVAVADPYLPYLNKKQLLFAYQGSGPVPGLLSAEEEPGQGISSTGTGWRNRPICQNPCVACNTGEATHPHDTKLLQQVKRKKDDKEKRKVKVLLASPQPPTAGSPGTLAALGLSTESAMKPRKLRRHAKGHRSGLRTLPPPPDSNPFQYLLARRWGYSKAVRTWATCLKWGQPGAVLPLDRALKSIFRGEKQNSMTVATAGRRGHNSFSLEEVEGVILVRGRDMDQGEPGSEPSVMTPRAHILFKEQRDAYLVPLIHSSFALALAVVQQVHIGHCGESPASLSARVSQYFHLSGSGLITCRKVCSTCHGCRRVCGKPGRNKIRRLRHIGQSDLLEGSAVLIDVAGPFLVYLQARRVGATQTRAVSSGARRVVVKRWVLLAVDSFSHRLETSELEDLSTSTVLGGINEVFAASGWRTTRLAVDPGSSLAPAASQALSAGADLEQVEKEPEDEERQESARQHLVAGLQQQGFKLRPCYAKSPHRQAKVESTVQVFKKALYSSLKPGTTDLTVSSFGRYMRLCTAMVNGRPVVVLPEGGRHPGQGMVCSPTSLRGPSHAQWSEMAASRDARGQYAIIKQLEARFQHNWVTFYSRRLRTNTKLDRYRAPTDSWPVGSILLILDLPSRAGRLHPHPRLGMLEKYLDEDENHAWVSYSGLHGRAYVDRPLSQLVYLTSSITQVPKEGLYFDPLLQGDLEALEGGGEEAEPPEIAVLEEEKNEDNQEKVAPSDYRPPVVGDTDPEQPDPAAEQVQEPRRSGRNRQKPRRFDH